MTDNDTTDFRSFPKMGRLFRDVVITEKLDGTNAQILITEDGQFLVGSRTRWITPEQDNHGFAKWAYEHKDELMQLGPGRHFGEWWGAGIQRKYGLQDKRFSLFNTIRWTLHGTEPQRIATADPTVEKYQDILPACCGLVPVLYKGLFSLDHVTRVMDDLRAHGSIAAPGFMNPEGIIVFHTSAGVGFKVTLEHDGIPKSLIPQE